MGKAAISGALVFLNMGFVLLLCGCYSALHHAQVIDGPSVTFAYRSLYGEVWRSANAAIDTDEWLILEPEVYKGIPSVAFRYGRAASRIGDVGDSIGLRLDQIGELEAPTLGLSPWVDGFLQFPKNRVIDWGIGTEFSLIALFAGSPLFVPYITLGRDIGTRFASYCEFRILPPTVTPGILLRIIRNLSLFAEANLIMGDDVVNGMNS